MSMRSLLTRFSLLILFAVFAAACTITPLKQASPPSSAPDAASKMATTPATVTKVVDGDTIDVRFDDGTKERVRFIGVDTPETVKPGTLVQPFGPEASAFTKKALRDRDVFLEFDVQQRDRYGRLLAYIWLEQPPESPDMDFIQENMFNVVLLMAGLAQVATFPPDVKYVDYFTEFQKKARDARAGMWAAGNTSAGDQGETSIKIVFVTSPVKTGTEASVVAGTTPGTECAIVVHYKSGPSGAAGLEPQAANAQGRVTWTWQVASSTTAGTWDIDVTCGGATVTTTFTVEE